MRFLNKNQHSRLRREENDSAKHVTVRLACVRHAASIHPEPGSNSPLKIDKGLAP